MSRLFELFRRSPATIGTGVYDFARAEPPQARRDLRQLRGARGRALCGFAALLFLIAIPTAVGAQSWSTDKAQRVDQLVNHFRQVNNDGATLPSLSIAIGVNGQLAVAKGYGASDGKPVTERTLYEVGSLTKQFTAAAILELIQEGATAPDSQTKLSLDTPLAAIFGKSSFGKSSYWADQPWLTVGRLLTMTSNLPNFTHHPPSDTNPWEPVPAEHLLADIENSPPTTASNDFDYSNTNYFLLAEVLERVAAPGAAAPESYHDFLRKHLFEPAGMANTGFIGEQPDELAPPDPYALPDSQPISTATVEQGAMIALPDYRLRRRPPFTNPDWLKGSGDVMSSALDIYAWHKAFMSGQIVPAGVRDQMFSDASRVTPFVYYGMGWFCEHKDDGEDVYSHSGAVPGYTSYNTIIRLKTGGRWISITLLSNSDQLEGLDDLAGSIATVILE